MGQTCCRPATKGSSAPQPTSNAALVKPTQDQQHGNQTVDHVGNSVYEISEEDDEYWDALSAASLQTAASHLSLDDFLDQWHEDLHGEDADLEENLHLIESLRVQGGHLVPQGIEAAAAEDAEVSRKKDLSVGGVAGQAVTTVKVETAPGTGEKRTDQHDEGALLHAWHTLTRFLRGGSFEEIPHDQDAAADIRGARELIENGRILEAHEMLVRLCTRSRLRLEDLVPHSKVVGINVAALVSDVHAIHASLEELSDDSGWMVSRDNDFRLLYRHVKGTTQHCLKFRALFRHPPGHILALAHEWDLLPTWNRFALDAVKLAEPSIFESFVYGVQWMIKPFRHMDVTVHARGFDVAASHKALLITVRDAVELPPGHAPIPDAAANRRTVNVLPHSCILLRPQPTGADGEAHTEAHMLVNLDPHIPFVPGVLVNFVLGILAPYIVSQMHKVLDTAFSDPAGDFPTRMAHQPELYGFIERRMREFAEELGWSRTD